MNNSHPRLFITLFCVIWIYEFLTDELLDAHRFELEEEINPLLHDLKATIPKHQRHYEIYYQKLIAATIIRAGMGPHNEYTIVKQTEGLASLVN